MVDTLVLGNQYRKVCRFDSCYPYMATALLIIGSVAVGVIVGGYAIALYIASNFWR